MANLTIKKIAPGILKRLSAQAKKSGKSLNAYVKELFEDHVGLKPGVTRYPDLSHLAGTWTPEEEKEFFANIRPLSEIDEELWK